MQHSKLVALRCVTGGSLQSFAGASGANNGTQVLEVQRAPSPYARTPSGTFVPHGSERTLGRYLTAPVTPFHHHHRPLTTCCVKERARAFAAHDCARGTHSHRCSTAFQRNSPTAGSYVALSLSQVHCHILSETVRYCWN